MQSESPSKNPEQFRSDFVSSMRRVCGTVAVVTTNGPAGRHGATVSSFCSVSADPPSLLVCLHDKSRITALVKENGRLCINVLSEDMKQIAERFSGMHDKQITERFDGIDCVHSDDASPAIEGAISFQCRLTSSALSGSHQIFIGDVIGITGTVETPLTYLDGQYHGWVSKTASVR